MEGKMGEWETKNGRDKKNTVTEGGGGGEGVEMVPSWLNGVLLVYNDTNFLAGLAVIFLGAINAY